jgi:excisionase family DNA binding protein
MAALTVVAVADQLACPVKTARALIAAGKIHGFKVGRRWRVRQQDVEAFIDRQRQLARDAASGVTTARVTRGSASVRQFPGWQIFL